MINAALNGDLEGASFEPDPIFGVHVPAACCDVPNEVLRPRNTWADKTAYDQQAHKLAHMFAGNFRQFEDMVTEEVRTAGPKVD
jgi:phosphoenolpyruvate carboxykinase (ATP)